MKKFLTNLFFINIVMFPLLSSAQKGILNSSKDVFNFSKMKVSRNSGIMYGYEPETEIEGSSYADSTWQKGSFIFLPEKKGEKNDTINGFTLRYDVFKGEVDILYKDNVYAATHSMLDGFFYQEKLRAKTHYFTNVNNFKSNQTDELKGFVEILTDGKLKLVKKYYISVKKPDYNPALNVGNRNYVIQQKTQYYYSIGKKIEPLESVKISSLTNDVMSAHVSKIEAYAKKEKINTKVEEDLVRLFNYFNAL